MSKIQLKGTTELQVLANRLKDAGDKKLNRKTAAAIRGVAKPVGQRVLASGAADMPRRGGLAAHLAGGKVGIRAGLAGKKVSVAILLKGDGYDLRPLDRGDLRHPVYGHKKWVRQSVPRNRFTVAFMNEAPTVRRAVLSAAQGVFDDVARGL